MDDGVKTYGKNTKEKKNEGNEIKDRGEKRKIF